MVQLQENLSKFLNNPANGGEATVIEPNIERIDNADLEAVLEGTKDGSVICSDQQTMNWTFATIESPIDWNHPVSGNREFGYVVNSEGSYTFYTRGVDRITDPFESAIAENLVDNPFKEPDNLWNSLKEGIYNYVQENGGVGMQPSDMDNSIDRLNWEDVKDVLIGEKPISDLGCN